jgi:hypothetical protein
LCILRTFFARHHLSMLRESGRRVSSFSSGHL